MNQTLAERLEQDRQRFQGLAGHAPGQVNHPRRNLETGGPSRFPARTQPGLQ